MYSGARCSVTPAELQTDPSENVAHGNVIAAYSITRWASSAFDLDSVDSPEVCPEDDGVVAEPDALEEFPRSASTMTNGLSKGGEQREEDHFNDGAAWATFSHEHDRTNWTSQNFYGPTFWSSMQYTELWHDMHMTSVIKLCARLVLSRVSIMMMS